MSKRLKFRKVISRGSCLWIHPNSVLVFKTTTTTTKFHRLAAAILSTILDPPRKVHLQVHPEADSEPSKILTQIKVSRIKEVISVIFSI